VTSSSLDVAPYCDVVCRSDVFSDDSVWLTASAVVADGAMVDVEVATEEAK
jgi:hypothetical protein